MPKISEMTLEELQDYALNLENENSGLKASNEEKEAQVQELTGLNKELQKRNNKLLLQVEQDTPEPAKEEPPKPVESCEEFARKLILNK